MIFVHTYDGFMQKRFNCRALAMELCLICINLLKFMYHIYCQTFNISCTNSQNVNGSYIVL